MRRSLVLILVCLPLAALHGQVPIGGSSHSTELRTFLRQTYYLTSSLGYTTARDRMYGQIDHVGGGWSACIPGIPKTARREAT